jgi:amidophosphoribosyltransferase
LKQDKLREECAVFGICINTDEAAGITYNGLLAMQHRGQEGAGIAVLEGRSVYCYKKIGLVSEVFSGRVLEQFPLSNMAVGHTRYSTTGMNTLQNVQPFVTEYLTGRIATVHNGNVTNSRMLKKKLEQDGVDFAASSDSEVVSALLAYYLRQSDDDVAALQQALPFLEGSFSLILMTSRGRLIAIRDRYGYRPLCIGQNQNGMVVASESCALDSCGFTFVRDVEPGEIVVIEGGKIVQEAKFTEVSRTGICIFEYVYFARPDSVIDHLSVYEARYNMGRILAEEHPAEADYVCGVPDSGLEAALGYADASGIPLAYGFVKNRYVGRSFIFPTQSQRDSAVKLKMNPLRAKVEGKRVVLVDDSIVRGTTSAQIIRGLKQAGAKEIYMRISSPPFRHTCYYGTDIGKKENLIANQMRIDEIQRKIGADSLGYISREGLVAACAKCRLGFCMGCFTGDYGVSVERIEQEGKSQLEED